MILDGPLVAPGDENQVRDAGGHGFFHRVLDQGLVDDGQHFLRHRLGRGQKTGAHAGNGKNGFTDGTH